MLWCGATERLTTHPAVTLALGYRTSPFMSAEASFEWQSFALPLSADKLDISRLATMVVFSEAPDSDDGRDREDDTVWSVTFCTWSDLENRHTSDNFLLRRALSRRLRLGGVRWARCLRSEALQQRVHQWIASHDHWAPSGYGMSGMCVTTNARDNCACHRGIGVSVFLASGPVHHLISGPWLSTFLEVLGSRPEEVVLATHSVGSRKQVPDPTHVGLVRVPGFFWLIGLTRLAVFPLSSFFSLL